MKDSEKLYNQPQEVTKIFAKYPNFANPWHMREAQIELISHYLPTMNPTTKARAQLTLGRLRSMVA